MTTFQNVNRHKFPKSYTAKCRTICRDTPLCPHNVGRSIIICFKRNGKIIVICIPIICSLFAQIELSTLYFSPRYIHRYTLCLIKMRERLNFLTLPDSNFLQQNCMVIIFTQQIYFQNLSWKIFTCRSWYIHRIYITDICQHSEQYACIAYIYSKAPLITRWLSCGTRPFQTLRNCLA